MDGRTLKILKRGVTFIRRELNAELPVQQLAILLEVYDEEGVTMPELSKRLVMSPASVSKNCRMMSKYMDGNEIKGYDLIRAEPDLQERRRFAIFLTGNGREFLNKLANYMG